MDRKDTDKTDLRHKRCVATEYPGISEFMDRELGRYYAYINFMCRTFSLGCYRNLSDAIAIRSEAVSVKEQGTEQFKAWYADFKERRKREASNLRKIASLPQVDRDGTVIPPPEERVARGISQRDNGFVVQIYYNRTTVAIGMFSTYREAVSARLEAEQHLDTDFMEWLGEFQKKHRDAYSKKNA